MNRRLLILLLVLLVSIVLAFCKKEKANSGDNHSEKTEISAEKKEEIEEREALEAERKEKYGEFYVPLPSLGTELTLKQVKARGIFVTTSAAGQSFSEENIDAYADYVTDGGEEPSVNTIEELLGIVKATELNTIVVDVKTDEGHVTYESDIEIVRQIDSMVPASQDKYKQLTDYCEANDIYLIARLVTFKDHYFAETEPDHAIQLNEGGVYRDGAGDAWVNPFDIYVWNYVIAIAKEVSLLGFDEIQFDYVRFPDGAARYNPITNFPGREDRDKDEAIEQFLAYAKEELAPYGVPISADVFGIITHTWDDIPEDIGQTWRKISNQVDIICPMIYPSHYSSGWYGYDYPDQHPYGVLYQSMQEAIERDAAMENPAALRPWIQGFTAPWVDGYIDYNAYEISEQIVACRDLGIEEYLIWAVNNRYDPAIFNYEERIGAVPREEGKDLMDRTPADAVEKYLRAQYNDFFATQYLLTPRADRDSDYDDFAATVEGKGWTLESYKVNDTHIDGDEMAVNVDAVYTSPEGTATLTGASYQVISEGGIYKVRMPDLAFKAPDTETETEE